MLAGSRGPEDPVARAAGVSHKAFAEVAGLSMIARVLDALAAEPRIGAVAVVIEPSAPALPAGATRIDSAPTPALSALAGFEAMEPPVLLTTADHPLLTPQMIAHFLDAAEGVAEGAAKKAGADVAAGVSLRPVVEEARSSARRTYLRFRDGEVSGCNLFALTTPRAARALSFWRRLEANRKRPWRMAWALGPATLARYALGRLSMAQAAAAIGRACDCRAAMLTLPFPDAAHDVDKPEDLAFAERRLRDRGA